MIKNAFSIYCDHGILRPQYVENAVRIPGFTEYHTAVFTKTACAVDKNLV